MTIKKIDPAPKIAISDEVLQKELMNFQRFLAMPYPFRKSKEQELEVNSYLIWRKEAGHG